VTHRFDPTPEAIAARIVAVPAAPARIGIDGIDCAGKTTLADLLAPPVARAGRPVIRASIDGFLRPRAERYRLGSLSGEGYYRDSFDLDALRARLLDPLAPGGDRRHVTAVWDEQGDCAVEAEPAIAAADAVVIVDGVFLQRPEIRGAWDLVIWVDVSFEDALRRAEARDRGRFGDGTDVRERYLARYQPGQRRYLTECDPIRSADLVVRSG
jgi:uridine kinase